MTEPSGHLDRVAEILEQAVALQGAEREAYLRSACGTDDALRAEVESLIAAQAKQGAFLADPTCGTLPEAASTIGTSSRETPGTLIGPYKLLQLIGEGGFGSVFMAEQEKPVARRVALKVIKLGMDTRQVIARFEQERQALAMMDHPNIARVLDAGATETGRPFFVMELVKGDPIVEYCDKHNLAITDRLELFSQVCTAVQHAHTKGIIHRDIKPSNVLVSTQDGKPHAKVIDFGIAKATASKLTEKTLFTEHRQLIGTPEYMSPEQAEGSLDLDTRTDVYSLGVLLYELLTGTTPFSSQELRSAAYAEIQRIIREVEPPKPSTRLSNITDTIATVAARRHTEPRRLSLIVRGELDWIVMKALEKDRSRRYESATGLGMDVRRYLHGDPVLAAPPSAMYLMKKFARRHRAGVLLASAVSVTVVLGLVGTSMGFAKAVRERERADGEARAARAAQKDAQERAKDLERVASFQRTQLAGVDVMQMGVQIRQDLLARLKRAAESSHESAANIDADLTALDNVLARVDLTGVARTALEHEILRPSIDAINEQFATQPMVRAELLMSLSESARRLGLFDLAEAPGQEAIKVHAAESGPRSAKALDARMRGAMLAKDRGRLDEAEKELRECLTIAQNEHGEAAQVTADLHSNLATVLGVRTKYPEAEEHYERALAWYRANADPLDPDALGCMASLGSTLANLSRFDEAEPLFRESLDGLRATIGPNSPRTIQSMNNFAGFYRSKGDFAKAEEMYAAALGSSRRVLGEDHWLSLMIIDNLGGVRFALKDSKGAATYARAALDGRRRVLGEGHAATLRSCFNLAKVLESLDEHDGAISLYREAAAGFARTYGEFHGHTISARTALAGLLVNTGKYEECSDLLLGELTHLDADTQAPKDRRRAVVRALGILYEMWDRAEPGKGYDDKAAEWKARQERDPAPGGDR